MRSVTISALKTHLSAHLKHVQEGEEIIIRDRNTPIARLIPCDLTDYNEHEIKLIATGAMVPAKEKLTPAVLKSLPKPVGNVSRETMEQIWREERDDR